jgi:alkaline phosphatase D
MDSSFQHGVASGDPLSDRVIIWTRATTEAPELPVGWRVARDPELRDVVAEGQAVASAERDHTVHVDVTGLEPGTTYHYGFSVDGVDSPVGRTKTLPVAPIESLRFAMCSCAKFNAGFFNAYARIAERDDLDFLLHLGDYIYEASQNPPATQTKSKDIGRPFEPLTECRTLEEYRMRYSQYHRDPDVQALHHRLPMIATLDDHELADGAWSGGATEHKPEHGPWQERLDAALRARWEWLPARPPAADDPTRVFRSVEVGDLAELMLLDVRSRRDEPVPGPDMHRGDRSKLGTEQRDWLLGELEESDAAWQLVVSPSTLSTTWVAAPAEPLRTALLKLKLIHAEGNDPDEDQWDGYPAEREMLVERMAAANGDAIVLSGDLHISMAGEVRSSANGSEAAVVEFTTPSLTSQNLDDKLGLDARAPEIQAAEAAMTDALDGIEWCEFSSHGYVVVEIDQQKARAEWWHVDTVLEPSQHERMAAAYEVARGETKLREAVTAR